MLDEIHRNFTSHALDQEKTEKCAKIRTKAWELARLLEEECPPCRERSLSLTNLEQAVFWANASVARQGK